MKYSDQNDCVPNGQMHSLSGLQLSPTLGVHEQDESQYSKYEEKDLTFSI